MKGSTIAFIALAMAGVSCRRDAPAPAKTTAPPAEIVAKAPGEVAPVMKATDAPESGKLGSLPAGVGVPVLSDPDLVAHRAFRVLHRADDAEVARLKGFGIDLERSSGRDHHTIAIPPSSPSTRTGSFAGLTRARTTRCGPRPVSFSTRWTAWAGAPERR